MLPQVLSKIEVGDPEVVTPFADTVGFVNCEELEVRRADRFDPLGEHFIGKFAVRCEFVNGVG